MGGTRSLHQHTPPTTRKPDPDHKQSCDGGANNGGLRRGDKAAHKIHASRKALQPRGLPARHRPGLAPAKVRVGSPGPSARARVAARPTLQALRAPRGEFVIRGTSRLGWPRWPRCPDWPGRLGPGGSDQAAPQPGLLGLSLSEACCSAKFTSLGPIYSEATRRALVLDERRPAPRCPR